MLGLYSSLATSLITTVLHIHNHAISGGIIAITFAASLSVQLLFQRIPQRAGLVAGLAILLVGLGFFVAALTTSPFLLFVVGTVLIGSGQGLTQRGGLTLINNIAPSAQRGEVLSSFFVIGYLGTGLPVFGLGVLAGTLGLFHATLAFAIIIGAMVIGTILITFQIER